MTQRKLSSLSKPILHLHMFQYALDHSWGLRLQHHIVKARRLKELWCIKLHQVSFAWSERLGLYRHKSQHYQRSALNNYLEAEGISLLLLYHLSLLLLLSSFLVSQALKSPLLLGRILLLPSLQVPHLQENFFTLQLAFPTASACQPRVRGSMRMINSCFPLYQRHL